MPDTDTFATFVRHNNLQEDCYELTIMVPTKIRVPVVNLNLAMDALGLASDGATKGAILALMDGQSSTMPITVESDTKERLESLAI